MRSSTVRIQRTLQALDPFVVSRAFVPPIIAGIAVLVLQGLLIALTFLFGLALSGLVFLVVVWRLVREGLSLLETLNTARSVDVWWRRWRRRPPPATAT
jgi:hypothetical protein